MADPAKSDIVAELERYNEVSKRNKEYLIHTKLGGELFLKYPVDEANRIIDVLCLCLTAAHIEPKDTKVALKAARARFSYMTKDDPVLIRMLDDNINKMYDVVEKKTWF